MRRRTVQAVVLLFCFSLGMSQIKVEHSMFRDSNVAGDQPAFELRLQQAVGSPNSLATNTSTSLLDLPFSTIGCAMTDSTSAAETRASAPSNDTVPSKKSPGLAMLMSMVIPGSGQVYVHRYITIPIIWGFGIYFAKAWNDQNNRYIYYRNLFSASVLEDTVNHQGNGVYQSDRDFYRDDRDKFAFYLGITYILNILDAYVGASLYSFDVSDNLGGSAALRLRIPIE